MIRAAIIFALMFWSLPAIALEPSEMLADPALEARARALDFEIRCVKCQSEAIASSNADWARDARRISRELIEGGASDAEVKEWFLARYGDFVLMDPPKTGTNLLLWIAGPVFLMLGGVFVWAGQRRRRGNQNSDAVLTSDESDRLRELLEK